MAQQTCHLALSPLISAKFYIALKRFKPTIFSQVCDVGSQEGEAGGRLPHRMHYAQALTQGKPYLGLELPKKMQKLVVSTYSLIHVLYGLGKAASVHITTNFCMSVRNITGKYSQDFCLLLRRSTKNKRGIIKFSHT